MLFVAYLVKLEDVRHFILDGLYKIPQCTIPPIDTLTDAAFEYSIIANLLLVRSFFQHFNPNSTPFIPPWDAWMLDVTF